MSGNEKGLWKRTIYSARIGFQEFLTLLHIFIILNILIIVYNYLVHFFVVHITEEFDLNGTELGEISRKKLSFTN